METVHQKKTPLHYGRRGDHGLAIGVYEDERCLAK